MTAIFAHAARSQKNPRGQIAAGSRDALRLRPAILPTLQSASAALLCRQSYKGTAGRPTRWLGMRSLVTLKFVCPVTKRELQYRLQADAQTLVKRWTKNLKCRCPHCSGVHNFSFRAGYVDGMIGHVGLLAEPTQSLTRFLTQ
jgi:hypothetical protein